MGRLANVVLRGAKMDAHEAFDPLWQAKMRRDKCTKNEAKRAGYRWLAKVLSIPEDRCHIAYMDVDECRRVVRVCKELRS